MACEACFSIPPVQAEYAGVGVTEKLGDLDGKCLLNVSAGVHFTAIIYSLIYLLAHHPCQHLGICVIVWESIVSQIQVLSPHSALSGCSRTSFVDRWRKPDWSRTELWCPGTKSR
jgi:hypothetical protein